MKHIQGNSKSIVFAIVSAVAVSVTGCGPSFYTLRKEGEKAFLRGEPGPARYYYAQAYEQKPRHVDNLHDLGVCSFVLAKERLAQMNKAAAMRELDRAAGYFRAALDAEPANMACREGLNNTLELKGRYDEALADAKWAAENVGPSATQHIFLAKQLEERGDIDGALLRYRQAVAMEPNNAEAHVAIAKFLLRHNNEVAALHHLQAAYKLNPEDPWVADQLSARGATPMLASEPR